MKIELKKIEIEIYTKRQNKRELVFSTPISDASDQIVEDASQPRVFPLNYQELQNLMPHLKVGNTAVVVVEYLAQTYGELHISVIGHSPEEHEPQEILTGTKRSQVIAAHPRPRVAIDLHVTRVASPARGPYASDNSLHIGGEMLV